jgi:hypothetical protein
MMPETPNLLAHIVQELIGEHVIGLRTGLLLTAGPEDGLACPQFEQQAWCLEIVDGIPRIPPDLLTALRSDEQPRLFIDTLLPRERARPRLVVNTPRGTHREGGAILHHVCEHIPPGTTIAFFASASILTVRHAEAIRANLDEFHSVNWIVLVDGQLLRGMHLSAQFVLIVCQVGAGPAQVTRWVDLRRTDPLAWLGEIQAARERQAGEHGRSIVLRNTRLGNGAWTYERWSASFSAAIADATQVGPLRPLQELVEGVQRGLHPTRDARILRLVAEDQPVPRGLLPAIAGRDVRRQGIILPGRYWVHPDEVPLEQRLVGGDLLIQELVGPGPHGPRIGAAIVPPGLDAVVGPYVLRLRWRESVPAQVRNLIASWLTNEQASRSLAVAGHAGFHLSPATLLTLEVPYPNDTLLAALEDLGRAEDWYRERADAVETARRELFAARRFAESIPMLLRVRQTERERMTAAEDSQKFEYRVRNYFPHPIALRREHLETHDHGKARVEQVLECAEHLVHFLAICGLLQLRNLRPNGALPSQRLQNLFRRDSVHFSWGLSWAVVKEAMDASRNADDPLTTPIPQFSQFNSATILDAAEAELRRSRNENAHLRRTPDSEFVERSQHLSSLLDTMLEELRFLADIPLVHVRDYWLDEVTGERKVKLDLMRGASDAFDRDERSVEHEHSRGAIGLIGHSGQLHSLSPWLIRRDCNICRRPETFIFNRWQREVVTFVAMETGHPWEEPGMGRVFSAFRARPS